MELIQADFKPIVLPSKMLTMLHEGVSHDVKLFARSSEALLEAGADVLEWRLLQSRLDGVQ